MNNGINFSMDGPIMDGTWYNPQTSDIFTVRDTFFQDNQLVVHTTDGRMLDYNTIQNYVKTDKNFTPEQKKQTTHELPPEVSSLVETANDSDSLMTAEDQVLIAGGTIQPQLTNTISSRVVSQSNLGGVATLRPGESEDDMLVRRILKRSTTPTVDCKVNWKSFPVKQMEMLDMMAVDINAIVDYYIKDIDLEQIREIIKEGIRKYIEKSMHAEEQAEEKEGKPIKEETTSKPTNKTKENKLKNSNKR